MITVVTATYNAGKELPDAISSLRQQTDNEFKWLIIDGASADNTIELIKSIHDMDVTYISEPDFGIYDALNKAIPLIKTPYYLVMGADDVLYPHAIEAFKAKAAQTNADLITAYTRWGKRPRKPNGRYTWLRGIWSVISTHSVGTLIKTELHQKHGLYSKRFPIAADMDFITRLYKANIHIEYIHDYVGLHSDTGVSTLDRLGAQTESFRIRVETGHWLITEAIFLCLKLLYQYHTISTNLKRFRKP